MNKFSRNASNEIVNCTFLIKNTTSRISLLCNSEMLMNVLRCFALFIWVGLWMKVCGQIHARRAIDDAAVHV